MAWNGKQHVVVDCLRDEVEGSFLKLLYGIMGFLVAFLLYKGFN